MCYRQIKEMVRQGLEPSSSIMSLINYHQYLDISPVMTVLGSLKRFRRPTKIRSTRTCKRERGRTCTCVRACWERVEILTYSKDFINYPSCPVEVWTTSGERGNQRFNIPSRTPTSLSSRTLTHSTP